MNDIVERLRSFAQAYPEDIFLPLTKEQTAAHSLIVTRASAGMGRHFAPIATQAADEIERLRKQITDQRRGEFICNRCHLRQDAELPAGVPEF